MVSGVVRCAATSNKKKPDLAPIRRFTRATSVKTDPSTKSNHDQALTRDKVYLCSVVLSIWDRVGVGKIKPNAQIQDATLRVDIAT